MDEGQLEAKVALLSTLSRYDPVAEHSAPYDREMVKAIRAAYTLKRPELAAEERYKENLKEFFKAMQFWDQWLRDHEKSV